jgi:glycosyltransferase involved in cell wall biosynthesis
MRIGVDATCWANGRGYGRYVRQLVPAMAAAAPDDRFICFLDPRSADRFDCRASNVEPRLVSQAQAPTQAAAAGGFRSPWDMLRLTAAVARERADVFFSPSVYTYFPLPPRQRAVVTIHDAIAERFPEQTLPDRRARTFWNFKVRLALWQCRLVLTVSDFAAGELAEVLAVDPKRIRVATEAPAPAFGPPSSAEEIALAAARYGIDPGRPWFTYVGGFNPHKRIDTLIEAHARIVRQSAGATPQLALVGSRDGDVFHSEGDRLRSMIVSAGTTEHVRWTGFVPDDELRHLHAGAVALLLASSAEGFGLPAVEAAACGVPVVATNASPLPDLLAGGGIFVRPGSTDDVAAAMAELLADPVRRRAMGRTARCRAGALSWERCGREAVAALREAAA